MTTTVAAPETLLENSAPPSTIVPKVGKNGERIDEFEFVFPQPRILATVVGTICEIGTPPPIPFEDPREESER